VQIEILFDEDASPGLDLGHIQHIVDQVQQMISAAADDRQVFLLFRIEICAALQQPG